MHEIFLQRLAAHPTLRRDHNLSVFLEYSQDLSVREKNRKEVLGGFLKSIVRSADEVLITGISGLKEVDDFFEHERTFLVEYHTRIRDTCQRADRVMHSHKCLADNYIPLSAALSSLGTQAVNQLKRSFLKLAELFERLRVSTAFCTQSSLELIGVLGGSHSRLASKDMKTCKKRASQTVRGGSGSKAQGMLWKTVLSPSFC
ncbi:similar to Sorting nexin 6 (TRAF4-associated factor 2) (predicted), isoform CRA_b [Rattus norvegicus]|uniref:Similar to Sorting nexin 6 (TRAF4-associated factor 2) (Predicted), isoform CRA_b n=1 Tax=Rattus norvegicus TaxID=10116 RepID=A6HZ73_RAT|nr:similar to Sorting nexin 6 (TRAF4-associated factor 2) (predicted), isoform CRA_b [Rattus norvegicus]